MAKPPAYIFVVRHGMRLDAADKTWAESSTTPYDTPLCYSGWIQARAVGARIASILAQAEAESEAPQSPTLTPAASHQRPRRRRFKVAIHCSPFLRCVQTAIGISAGLAQPITGPPAMPTAATRRGAQPNPVVIPSPILKPTGSTRPILDSLESLDSQHHHHFHKAILRLDEFLGEWLSAGYYETIEPPPKASTMIANAKAQLLKREIYAKNFNQSVTSPVSAAAASHLSPQLWTGGRTSTVVVPEDPFEDHDSDPETEDLPPPRPLGELGYIAPVPHYAISSSDKIPDSYVAHARDSCVVFDYQWESSGPDLDWGDGGTFPEEWTSMHNRFRKGVQGLVDWYSTTEDAADIAHIRGAAELDKIEDTWSEDGDDDVDIESVVIMVSHGAGCNALIGAMTHQPALMDVSMASLTMAVRKTGSEYEHMSPWLPNSDQTDDTSLDTVKNSIPVHQYYDMRLVASTEHLRTASSSAGLVRSGVIPSWSFGINKPVVNRGRVSTMTSSYAPAPVLAPRLLTKPENAMWSHSRSSSVSAAFGLPETRLFGCRKEDDADYCFSSANNDDFTAHGATNGGITVGSGVTSFMKKHDDSGLAKNPAINSTSKLAASKLKALSTKGLPSTTGVGRLNSPLSTSTIYSDAVISSNDRVFTGTTGPSSMSSSISSLPPLQVSSTKGNNGLWGITNRKTSSSSVLVEDDDEDDFFPDFDNKKKFTPPISQNTSQRTSPTLALKSTLGSLNLPLNPPSLMALSSDSTSLTTTTAKSPLIGHELPSFAISVTSSPEGAMNAYSGSSILSHASRLDRLGNPPVRSPIHSPMGSPVREPLVSPFFGDTSGSVEPVIRSRITTSRMWGASGS
ncbi:hypothetical protein BROUX41_005866 [Berkeleyomyces rouxiae]|uniref:uncharacterized protein n=1 Tax=Berkeleyomyces rouxiae TaxID=2035830 RepID=UPI003B805959